MPRNILIDPQRTGTANPNIQFSGSMANTIKLEVLTSGSVQFTGVSGSLLNVTDSLSGSLFAVSDVSGLPIIEVFSDDKVVLGQFNTNAFVVTGSRVGMGTNNPDVRLVISGGLGNIRIGEVFPAYNGITLNGLTSQNDYNFASRTTDQNLYINRPASQAIQFREANTNQIIFTAGGNVGVGTQTVGTNNALTVYRGSTTSAFISSTGNANTPGSTDAVFGQDTTSVMYVWNRANAAAIFGTNSSERMRIDALGRLLIGGTSTYDFNGQANLVVNGTANNATITVASTGIGYLAFADGTSGGDRFAGQVQYTHSSDTMSFRTAAAVRVTIDSSGNVGIGTETSTARLVVSGSSTASTPTMLVREGVVSPTAGALAFEVENSRGSTLFAVSGSGNVGIGTSNPAGVFEVVGVSGSLLLVTDNLSGSLFSVNDVTGLPIFEVFSDDTIIAGAVNSNALVVTGSRVGIGVSTPDTRLDVYTTSANGTDGLRVFGGATTSNVRIRPAMSSGTNNNIVQNGDSGIIYDAGAQDTGAFVIAPWASSTCGLRMDAVGRVGIGTTAANAPLEVRSTADEVSRFVSTGNPYISLYSGTTRHGYFYSDGSVVQIVSEASKSFAVRSATTLNLQSNGSSSSSIFTLDTAGNVGIGTAAPGTKLHVEAGNIRVSSGYGIDFSLTANATGGASISEVLDDYEEGTWTPSYWKDGAETTTQYTTTANAGNYVKVGAKVTVWFSATISTKIAGDQVFVTDLPYPVDGGVTDIVGQWYPTVPTVTSGITVGDLVLLTPCGGVAYAEMLYFLNDGSGASSGGNILYNANSAFVGTLTYWTNS